MTRWIRWQGLGAFILACFILAIVWFVVADWVVEKSIEVAGSHVVGAKVEVADADVTMFPAGVAVFGLSVTDPQQPMRNSLEIKRLHAAVVLAPLLKRKIIIDDLQIQGLRLNTPRKTSGALKRKTAHKDQTKTTPAWLDDLCGIGSLPQMRLPSAEEILGREPLQSLQMARELRAKVATTQTNWQQRLKELPDQQRLAAYQSRIDKLKKSKGDLGALLGSADKVRSLIEDVQKDLKQIEKAKKTFGFELDNLQKASTKLAAAPDAEVKRLLNKYTLNAAGVANLSRLLFGKQVCGWWQKGYAWYVRLAPYLNRVPTVPGAPEQTRPLRSKGVDVHFKERNPIPDFLIRQLHVDAQLDVGEFSGQMANITSQPQVLGAPLTYKFLGRRMRKMSAFNLNGFMNLVQPQAPRHSVKLQIDQYALTHLLLGDPEHLPLDITQAMANIHFDLNLTGKRLDALLKAQLDQVQMQIQQAATSTLASALADALSATRHFNFTAAFKGVAPEIEARLKSDLDKTLQKAVSRVVQKSSDQLAAQIRKGIGSKTTDAISAAQTDLAGLNVIGDQLTQRINIGNDILKKIKLPI